MNDLYDADILTWSEQQAELLRRRGYDTLAARREVSSPGGVTARGLDALERGGVRAAFSDALDAVLEIVQPAR